MTDIEIFKRELKTVEDFDFDYLERNTMLELLNDYCVEREKVNHYLANTKIDDFDQYVELGNKLHLLNHKAFLYKNYVSGLINKYTDKETENENE